jgi:RNA polymerase sigma-70 factor, ECF subfamily
VDRHDRAEPPVVALNRAVAVAETEGPDAGLALLDGVVEQLDGYHLLHASRGSMLERLGRPHQAAEAYDRAAALARTDADVAFLSRRHAEFAVGHGGALDREGALPVGDPSARD